MKKGLSHTLISFLILGNLHAFASIDCRKKLETASVQVISADISQIDQIDEIQQTILLKNHKSFDLGFYFQPETKEFLKIAVESPFSVVAAIDSALVGYFLFHEVNTLENLNPAHFQRIQSLLSQLSLQSGDGIYGAGIAVKRDANTIYRGLGGKLYDAGITKLRGAHKRFMIFEIALDPLNEHSFHFFKHRAAEQVDSYVSDKTGVKWGIFLVRF